MAVENVEGLEEAIAAARDDGHRAGRAEGYAAGRQDASAILRLDAARSVEGLAAELAADAAITPERAGAILAQAASAVQAAGPANYRERLAKVDPKIGADTPADPPQDEAVARVGRIKEFATAIRRGGK